MTGVLEIPTVNAGELPPAACVELLQARGCLHVRGAFAPGFVRAALDAQTAQMAQGAQTVQTVQTTPTAQGALEIAGPLASPAFLVNPHLDPLWRGVLGEGFILGRLDRGAPVVRLGAGAMAPSPVALFGDPAVDALVPMVGLVSRIAGDGQVVRLSSGAEVELADGSCLLHDARDTASGGGLAIVAHHYRSWFREPPAPADQPPVAISRATYQALPEPQRSLFAWRFDRYASHRRRLLVHRAVSRLPPPLASRAALLLARGTAAVARIARRARGQSPPRA